MPVAFGKFTGLDALKTAEWHDMADAVDVINALLLDLIERDMKGLGPSADFQAKIMKENSRLLKLAAGIMGKIPTERIGNGEFTHPLILSNVMAAMLDNAELSLTDAQRAEVAFLGDELLQ